MPRLRYTLSLALMLGAPPASAQLPAALPDAGARVRVSIPPSRRVTGTVVAYRGDTLLLRRAVLHGAETTAVALGDAHRLEVSAGKRRRVLKGALVGVAAGAGVGAVLGAAAYSDAPPRCYQDGREVPCFINLDFGRGFSAMAGGVLGGAAGLVAGLLVGARQVDRWEAVAIAWRSSRLRLLPPTERSGLGVAAAVGF